MFYLSMGIEGNFSYLTPCPLIHSRIKLADLFHRRSDAHPTFCTSLVRREDDCGWMSWIVINLLFCHMERRGRPKRLPFSQIACEMGMGPTRDLEPDAVSSTEAVGRRPQIDADPQTAVGLPCGMIRPDPRQSTRDVDRLARRGHITQASEEVRVFQKTTHETHKTFPSCQLLTV